MKKYHGSNILDMWKVKLLRALVYCIKSSHFQIKHRHYLFTYTTYIAISSMEICMGQYKQDKFKNLRNQQKHAIRENRFEHTNELYFFGKYFEDLETNIYNVSVFIHKINVNQAPLTFNGVFYKIIYKYPTKFLELSYAKPKLKFNSK